MAKETGNTTRILACAVFKPAVEHLQLEIKYPNLQLTYLPSDLHLRPNDLKKRLLKEILSAKKRKERVICLYGDCCPGIGDLLKQHGVIEVPGHQCYEMLLGTERFTRLLEENTGTFFAEQDLILNFEEYCAIPLELHDEEMRQYIFEKYQKLLYLRQPSDPEIVPLASNMAKFLELSLEISDADYSHLEKYFSEVL